RNFSAPHMFDMQALKFLEQRRIATEFGLIEVPYIGLPHRVRCLDQPVFQPPGRSDDPHSARS
ncbi:MAG: hypothetical protein NUV63_14510, partial [Gallionella sp.]|nr:hypothetical protein [Gallionella sp.]